MMASLRFESINKLLTREGPFQSPNFEPSSENLDLLLNHAKVLVVGAGGLGCELLKDLALSGFRHISVIDMDTIEFSNLNRQFLFRTSDVGKFKAEVAAKYTNWRVPGVNVTAYNTRLEDLDAEFYSSFHVILLGLDSISARDWINSLVHRVVRIDLDGKVDESTVIPIIDGGTEGLKGSVQVLVPTKTHCFRCMRGQYPETTAVQLCTIATKPRTPAHCVLWARHVHWPERLPFGGKQGCDCSAIERANFFSGRC
ncbi:NEDD8-activating enzyme E1 catalytic subunit-like [Zophobas morio]|uniref:NEDD8-activating enzyme E1 catalytic subunit-like n=1 Tax=Zophobas morio TaxID=2755281 RepID=UPI003083D160